MLRALAARETLQALSCGRYKAAETAAIHEERSELSSGNSQVADEITIGTLRVNGRIVRICN
ncbi:hypothetical protein [Ruegeria denitrificans]|uniref:hypothetical protein n=1 Tax=Ruegeria denitrificans TaxID=1715692 RepID=UPI00071D7F5D|nr:hypothetical protein [Ruegeria denitrificans]